MPHDRDPHGRPYPQYPPPGVQPGSVHPQHPQHPQTWQPQQPPQPQPPRYPQQTYPQQGWPQQQPHPGHQANHTGGWPAQPSTWPQQQPPFPHAQPSLPPKRAIPLGFSIAFGVVAAFLVAAVALKPLDGKKSGAAASASAPVEEPVAVVPSPLDAGRLAVAEIIDAGAPAPAAAVVPARTKRPLNVLFLTIDTLRADLGFAGYPRPVSPNLDALAKRSTVYENAYSLASYTPKSMGPMLIGRYGSETARNSEHYTKFFASNVFVSERAHDAGIRTMGGICHRYFMWNLGFEQGMDIYDMSATPPNPTDDDIRLTSDKLTDVAIKHLSNPSNTGRFYGWFHYVDPHTPYAPHPDAPSFAKMPPEKSAPQRAAYDAEVWYTDKEVGRLLDFVAKQPWAKDTAIIVTADHGESFGEHDHWRHGREVWESLIRVPLIVHLPDGEGKKVAAKRSAIDLVPTIMDLLDLPADPTLHGTSLLADIDAPADKIVERDVFVDMMKGPYNDQRRAIITGTSPGLKLIDFEGHRQEVYDLAADPLEGKPLKKGDPRIDEARDAYDKMLKSLVEVRVSP